MTRFTGAQALVERLRQHGVDTLFALPGAQLDPLFDALHAHRATLRVIHTRHEQGAAYMAYGYARASGRPGVAAVVPGPGLLNASAALATAWGNSTPVLCVSGQIPLPAIDRGYGELHEIRDQLGLIRHLSKWAERIEHPAQAPALVDEAFQRLTSGRPRPVALEMPMDTMAASAAVDLAPPPAGPPAPPVDEDRVEQAAALLQRAKRPLIVVGSGAAGAAGEVLALAEKLQAPVLAKRNGKGIVSARHYLSANLPMGHALWAEADCVLGVGTRLKGELTGWGKDEDLTLIRIDIDPVEIRRICEPELGIAGDAAATLAALNRVVRVQNPSRREELEALRARTDEAIRAQVGPQMAYLDAIREVLPEDGIFVDEITQCGFVAWYAFPVYAPRQYITASEMGTLGFGFATALGAAVATPGHKVVQISGDGGFMFTMPELATAVAHAIDVVTVVFNDNTYTNVQREQDEVYGGRRLGTDLHNPDFARLAETFGATGMKAETPGALRAALERGLATAGPVVIEVPVRERMPSPWKFIIMPQNRRQRCR